MRKLSALTLCAVIGSCSLPPTPGEQSLRLRQGMTQDQVSSALGYQPSESEMRTCGNETRKPFTCQVLRYGWPNWGILVVMAQSETDNQYVVKHWLVDEGK
jgi:hypothetical protein